ncbi:MAG: cytochrome c [Desulfobacterales bacterium]|nr:MAG: cytochrome c [Desulfobacterales bacterium]UCD91214.1 MAG: cytochrome c [Desulfobacterales bacterium]
MKKIVATFITVVFVFTSAGICFAADTGNKRKGKYTYRKVYKSCHQRGEVDSTSPSLSPNDKTQAEWQDIFDSKKLDVFGCKEEWDQLSEKDLLDIFSYLHAHASDSPNPVTCK